MKNALITGLVIGILSGLWLFVTNAMGYNTVSPHQIAPFEYISVLIPFVGLYFGIRNYRQTDMGGSISFLEGLIQSFKILIVGGVIAIFAAIVFVNYVSGAGANYTDFSGRMFGALLVGLLEALAVSLIVMNKHKAI